MLHSMFASHSTHSESSSPDILAPPGDADYLISSPFRPFPGRQSSLMSPANRRILHTPGAAKRKRSRISLSPAKSAHSIRFDDIVLPGSPTRKLDGRQRSASPDKVDADGNVSPWRIRVTLEATQDDQENQGSPSRKRPKQRTTTTKVPLKDSSEQTPRRRGRPRKSGASDTTPAAGSPGNTPGPVNSEQKRRRGRPRKHKPESDAAAENNVIENNEQPGGDVQMMDPALAGTELERRSWSPLNLAGDADSDDGIYDNEPLDIPFEGPAHTEFGEPEPPTEDPNPQPSIEPTYDTPNGDAIDRFNYQQGDDELHSTPSKMPSPTRELPTVSPENSIHAGHTPMPPRTYPTSASTSLVDNEQPERNQYSREPSASSSKPSAVRSSDPTNEHREFDSIIESEGFSMVSLDTLPSAQQHGLRSNPKLAKGALKPFIERETNGVLRRKTTIPEHQSEVASPPSPSPDPALSPERHLDSPQLRGSIRSSAAKRIPFSPIPTKGFSPAPQRKPLLRLAKLVRAGIALERVLSHSNPPYSPGNAVPDYMAPRQRLEVIFSDLNPESQRVLGAALGLGQVLAIRRKMMELRSPQRRALVAEELEDEDDHAGLDFEYTKREVSRTPNRQYDGAADPSPVSSSPDTDMKQRFAEWQRERDAVSRTIQMANSSQVIVIDSDVDTPNSNAGERDVGDLTPLVSQWNRKRHAEVQDDDYDNQEDGHVYDDNQNRRELGQEEKQQQRELEDDEGADVNQSRWMSRWNQDHQEEVQEDGYDNEEEEDIYDPRQSSREPRQEEEEEEAEQGELEEDNHGNQEQRSDYDDDQSLWMPKRNGEQQRAADEEKHDVEKGRADYVASQNSRIPRLDEYQHSEVVEEDYADVDEDDGYEDIWQVQAKYEGNSGRESMLEPQDELQSSPQKGGSTPADRGYSMSFSPTHWVDGQGKMPSLGQSRVRELREQEVDISALLRAEDTPNRARYYYGRSSPLSSAQGHSPQHNMLSSAASHRQKHVERYDDELGQLGEVEEPADYLDFSPEKDLEDETFQIDPTTRHESEMQRYPSDFADNASISDDAGDEPPVHEETLTPKNPAPANRGGQATSWYERITNLTPGWLKAPLQNPSPQNKHSSPPTNRSNSKEPSLEEQSEHSEQEEQDREQDWKQDSEYEKEEEEEEEEEEEGEQQHHVHSPDEDNSRKAQKPQPDPLSESEVDQIWAPSPQPKAKRTSETAKEEPNLTATEKSPEKPRRLATSGYFSNAHYTLLRRLYRLAKQSPESFTYHSSSSHSGIIGDYIWTSDNTYGVPVTELQFAIVYRFRQELAAEDLKSGGTGWVGWTDADLHRRLVSVIIGEQIREDRKNVHDLRPTRSKPRSIIQRG